METRQAQLDTACTAFVHSLSPHRLCTTTPGCMGESEIRVRARACVCPFPCHQRVPRASFCRQASITATGQKHFSREHRQREGEQQGQRRQRSPALQGALFPSSANKYTRGGEHRSSLEAMAGILRTACNYCTGHKVTRLDGQGSHNNSSNGVGAPDVTPSGEHEICFRITSARVRARFTYRSSAPLHINTAARPFVVTRASEHADFLILSVFLSTHPGQPPIHSDVSSQCHHSRQKPFLTE